MSTKINTIQVYDWNAEADSGDAVKNSAACLVSNNVQTRTAPAIFSEQKRTKFASKGLLFIGLQNSTFSTKVSETLGFDKLNFTPNRNPALQALIWLQEMNSQGFTVNRKVNFEFFSPNHKAFAEVWTDAFKTAFEILENSPALVEALTA